MSDRREPRADRKWNRWLSQIKYLHKYVPKGVQNNPKVFKM